MILFALILSNSSNAQIFRILKDIDAVEIAVGPNLYNIHYEEESPRDKLFVKPGFTATVNLHYQVRPQIDVSMRLFYDYKGYISRVLTNYYDSTWVNLIGRGERKSETYLNFAGFALLANLKSETQIFFLTQVRLLLTLLRAGVKVHFHGITQYPNIKWIRIKDFPVA